MFLLKDREWYVMEIKDLAYTTSQKGARRYPTFEVAQAEAAKIQPTPRIVQLLVRP